MFCILCTIIHIIQRYFVTISSYMQSIHNIVCLISCSIRTAQFDKLDGSSLHEAIIWNEGPYRTKIEWPVCLHKWTPHFIMYNMQQVIMKYLIHLINSSLKYNISIIFMNAWNTSILPKQLLWQMGKRHPTVTLDPFKDQHMFYNRFVLLNKPV